VESVDGDTIARSECDVHRTDTHALFDPEVSAPVSREAA
jgi:hypothetical protein